MSQAEVNIMTAGHVDHGKTTLISALTGIMTDSHSEEVKRGITIKLGYADMTIRKNAEGYTNEGEGEVVRKVSFLDAPGHETLMATVVAASSIVDGALFVIAANETCPQPQTLEHLLVLESIGVKNIVFVQTKLDLVTKDQAIKNYKEILTLLKGTPYEKSPVIPISAVTKANLDKLFEAIQENIPTPKRDETTAAQFLIARSFDVNKPGTKPAKILGGVLGGSVVCGVFKEGDEIELLPGYPQEKKDKRIYVPIRTKITSMNADGKIKEARPGGLVGIATGLDPALASGDLLVGNIAGKPGTLPPVLTELNLKMKPLKRALANFPETFVENEPVVIGSGTATTIGFVEGKSKGNRQAYHIRLKKPVCAAQGAVMAILRKASNRWNLYGTGTLI